MTAALPYLACYLIVVAVLVAGVILQDWCDRRG